MIYQEKTHVNVEHLHVAIYSYTNIHQPSWYTFESSKGPSVECVCTLNVAFLDLRFLPLFTTKTLLIIRGKTEN